MIVLMAKSLNIPVAADPRQAFTCGDCSNAFGFCLKGASGLPICCRCSLDDRYLKMVSEPACGTFDRRGTPLPTQFSFTISPRKDGAVPVL